MWPLGMEPLPPTHLNGVQQALADWCAHIHTCARHVHMGGIHVHWVGLPAGGQRHSMFRTGGRPNAHLCPRDTHVHRARCRVRPPVGDTHPGGAAGHTWTLCPLFPQETRGAPVPSGFGCPSRSSAFPSGSLSLFVFLQS